MPAEVSWVAHAGAALFLDFPVLGLRTGLYLGEQIPLFEGSPFLESNRTLPAFGVGLSLLAARPIHVSPGYSGQHTQERTQVALGALRCFLSLVVVWKGASNILP